MDETTDRSARRTTTSGSDTRPARSLDGAHVADLASEANTLLEEREWTDGDRNTRTLLAGDGMRVALIALRRDAAIGDDATNDSLVVQVLRGSVRVEGVGDTRELSAGALLALDRPRSWRVRAADESLLLLTTALGDPGPAR
jgi:quercetin dioxygenase-like cupin family protein